MIKFKTGNIFTTQCQTIVNTVNCVGVMGAGIALEFKLRHVEMFNRYKVICDKNQFNIGFLWIYSIPQNESTDSFQQILNFPTKNDWKAPSKVEYLELGLQKFVQTYKEKGITSVAFPLLGAARGGLSEDVAKQVMVKYLEQCDIDIEIWHFDPVAKDDLFEKFKVLFQSMDDESIKNLSKLRVGIIQTIKEGLNDPQINSISGLLRLKGVGAGSVEKAFLLMKQPIQVQQQLI